jgi:hypothetical protein
MDRDLDQDLRHILTTTRRIAVVGASPKPERPSHSVMRFLIDRGFEVYPVNPGQAGQTLLDRPVHAHLRDIPAQIDMVDIFRRSEEAGPIVDEAIGIGAKTVWMQLGVVDEAAAARAREAGLAVVMDRCPAIDMPRLGL